MKPLRGIVWVAALLGLAVAGPAQAAWHNVFQVCCHNCRSSPVVSSYYADPCCQPPPQVCTTRYVQRSYYQPVTRYESRSYYEPVTSYHTSYYYEPVTSYRYSCYYDPHTCSYQQVACPTTSYRLRSQCNAVTNYVQRCQYVPVTSYQQMSYYEPVTSCYNPCAPANGYVAPAPTGAPPVVSEGRQPGTLPGVSESTTPGTTDRYYPPANPLPLGPPNGMQSRQLPPRAVVPPPVPAGVKLERIVSIEPAKVEGQLVRSNQAPWSGAALVFSRVEKQGVPEQSVRTDAKGKFQVRLASGNWLVYTPGTDGKLALHSRLDVNDNETRQVMLVGR